MEFPAKLAFTDVLGERKPEWILERRQVGELAAGAGKYAVYENTNWRQKGMSAGASVYFAITGRLYGPYYIGQVTEGKQTRYVNRLEEMLKELNEMLKDGQTVRKLPGCKVEHCLITEGRVIE